jgi:hypothetical protein
LIAMQLDTFVVRTIREEQAREHRARLEHRNRLVRVGRQPVGWDELKRGLAAVIAGARRLADAPRAGSGSAQTDPLASGLVTSPDAAAAGSG